MHPDLFLIVHLQAERELTARLEHRRVALERAATAVRARTTPDRRGEGPARRAVARGRAAVRGLGALLSPSPAGRPVLATPRCTTAECPA